MIWLNIKNLCKSKRWIINRGRRLSLEWILRLLIIRELIVIGIINITIHLNCYSHQSVQWQAQEEKKGHPFISLFEMFIPTLLHLLLYPLATRILCIHRARSEVDLEVHQLTELCICSKFWERKLIKPKKKLITKNLI